MCVCVMMTRNLRGGDAGPRYDSQEKLVDEEKRPYLTYDNER